MNRSPGYCGWKADCEMATAVAYRSAPARRVKVVAAACAPAGATGATAVERVRAAVTATRVVMGILGMAGFYGAPGVRSYASVGAAAKGGSEAKSRPAGAGCRAQFVSPWQGFTGLTAKQPV